MMKDKMERSEKILLLAEIAHEANRAYCETIGDFSQKPWADAADWQRLSATNGVNGVLSGNTPEQSHESWLAEKQRTGWKYGPIKDEAKREHPCMVPYVELGPEQRVKDTIFVSSVRGAARTLGLL